MYPFSNFKTCIGLRKHTEERLSMERKLIFTWHVCATFAWHSPCRRRVNLESRYGTWALGFLSSSLSALITFPRARRPLLILTPVKLKGIERNAFTGIILNPLTWLCHTIIWLNVLWPYIWHTALRESSLYGTLSGNLHRSHALL